MPTLEGLILRLHGTVAAWQNAGDGMPFRMKANLLSPARGHGDAMSLQRVESWEEQGRKSCVQHDGAPDGRLLYSPVW